MPGVSPAATPGDAVKVELYFYGVAPLHQGFFANADVVADLGEALGACLTDTAQIVISYDSEEFTGAVVARVPPGTSRCLAAADADGVDLAPLVPITTALADYRDAVAAKFDFRVASFRIGASFTRGSHQCGVWAAGQHPPDGTGFKPCIELNGVASCQRGADDGVRRVDLRKAAERRFVAECFAR